MTRHGPFHYSGSPRDRIRRPHRYYCRAKTPCYHPDALRCLRTSVPSAFLFSLSYLLQVPERRATLQARVLRARPDGLPRQFLHDGTARGSQVPGESFPCLCPAQETPAAPFCHAIAAVRCCPRWSDDEGRNDINFEADSHSFSICCLRFQASVSLHWQDSLPAGGKPLPDGIRTHWTPMANFKQARQPVYSNAPGLAWRH